MQNFRVGDRVIIHPDIATLPSESPAINSEMRIMGGQEDVIKSMSDSLGSIRLENHGYYWLAKWLLPVTKATKRKGEIAVGDIVSKNGPIGTLVCWNPKKEDICGLFTTYPDDGTRLMDTICQACGTSGHRHGSYVRRGEVTLVSKGVNATKKDSASTKAMDRITLTDSQKKNLSKNAQALVAAGYYDGELELANEDHFITFLVNKFEDDYAADAQAKLDADDAEQAQTALAAKAAVSVKSK